MALTAMLLRQSCRGWVSCNQNKLKNTKYKTRELYVDQHRSSDGQGTLDKTTLISEESKSLQLDFASWQNSEYRANNYRDQQQRYMESTGRL